MPGLIEITRKRIMDAIKAIQPPGKWKIVVVDSKSYEILNASCKMYDILEENVSLVENIEKVRQPYPSLAAIYFLTPCRESILRLVDDFSAHKEPLYNAAHIYFTSGLDDDLFSDLNKRLKSTGAAEYVHGLKEMYVDYKVVESAVYTVDPVSSFFSVFGTDDRAYPEASLRHSAKQLLSLCVTLGEDPIIRYQVPPENDGKTPLLPYEGATKSLALSLQKELDHFCRLNPNFPPQRQPPQPRATILIVDRTLDEYAPILHEFTYQAMINDLLPVKPTENGTGIVYSYEYTQSDGSMGTKDVILDEEDDVYKSIRHLHIAECTDRLIENFNKFLADNKQAAGNSDSNTPPTDSAKSLKDMKDMLTKLPQFQEMKAKYSTHLSIAQELMSCFEKQKLNSVGNLEQNIATGETPDGEVPKTIVLDMVPLLDDPYISATDKTRLLMLYIISKEGGILEDDKRKLLEHSHLSQEHREAVGNLSLMGVQVTKNRRAPGEKSLRKRLTRRRQNRDDDQPYELSRYVPALKKSMDSFFSHQLDHQQFAFTRESDMDKVDTTGGSSLGQVQAGTHLTSGVSLRTTKPTWKNKSNGASGQRTSQGPKLIVFVIGGMTYSEIRAAYESSEAYHRDIFVGTTEILRPAKYVENLSQLRMPVPRIKSVIPPYTAPPSLTSIPSSLKSHMPQLSLSTSQISLGSQTTKSSSTTNISPSLDKSEGDKKKKKGLKKLFG
ncbi:Sec1-like protein [Halteromyces radiatus]|uniref:Sec1-like protein n=1 Tax=Halteromyces radiatus TaxID=101107 RepID=UPI00221FA4D9|nr:Sec1-like protein [Halteromyces radiatus]KAI8093278.1 Sec1-like protein [Halteromyces radiatus]